MTKKISQIVGEYVKLKNAGREDQLGLCPFHEEKTPSFTVNDKEGKFHCFGCGAHGNAKEFLEQLKVKRMVELVEEMA